MLLKYTVFIFVIVAVHSATLQGRNIPVEVRYERFDHDINSNLAEKVQLSSEELKESQLRLQNLSVADEEVSVPTKDHSNLNKNLDEKVQLSPEELLQSAKHIPIHHSLRDNAGDDDLNKLGELRSEPLPLSSNDDVSNKALLIQQAQDIIETGLQNLKSNFMPKENEIAPSKELWEKLENDVKEYFLQEKNKFGLRQDQGTNPQNIFQNFANGFQQLTNNFIQQFQGQSQSPANVTGEDEGTPLQPAQGPIQGFIGYFTGGVQNIVSNIQNIGQTGQQTSGNSTVLGDSGTGQQPGNFIGGFVSGVQQFFQGPQQGINQILSGNNTQGDTGTGNPPGGQGFFAGAINQFNQVVSNIIPTSQKPPAAQGDEGTGAAGASQGGNPIQQVFQSFGNIGTAFNQFVQGGQQNKSQDESSSPPQNQNFIQSIGQNIGNAIQNIQSQFRPTSTQKPAGDHDRIQPVAGQTGTNSTLQNLIPGSSSESSAKNPSDEQPATTASPEKRTTPGDPEKKEDMTATE